MKTTKILTLSLILPTLAFQSCEKKNSSDSDQAGHTGDCCPPPSEVIAPTTVSTEPAPTPQLNETPEQLEERLQWFRNAKFGLFIHWGPAAISGEEISWSMMDRIEGGDKHKVVPRETYMNLYKTFNPTNFNADELMGLAKNAGMKYFVFVTKHHDGFSMWPTKEKRFAEGADHPEHFSIADTPYEGDPVRMMQEAGKKHELKIGWYYSTRDWTHPDYLQGDNKVYNDYYENQVEELLNDYGPVDMVWFDHCFGNWDQYTIPRLYQKMYANNPQLLVNNRAAKGIKDIPEEYKALRLGDYDTPENRMGAFQHGRAWESCMILSPHTDHGGWSYRTGAETRSLTETLQLLSSCVTGDGNMLLNLAPLPDGSLKPEEKAILEGLAPWMATYNEAIYDTRGGPWINGSWGGASYRGNTVYLHLFNPTDEPLVLNALPQQITAATTIDGKAIPYTQDDQAKTVSITLPADARNAHVSIIKLTLASPVTGVLYGPALANESEIQIPGTMTFATDQATIKGSATLEKQGEDNTITNLTIDSSITWPLEIDSPGTYTIQLTTSAKKADSTLAVICGKIKTHYVHVPGTGDDNNFQTYNIGEVTFPNAESIQLTLRPADASSWAPINLRDVKFIPSN